MKIVIDACVLYPTVMREVVLGVALRGAFMPFWSARILEEWARAAAKHGALQAEQARSEIVLLNAAWPGATLPPAPGLEARLWLPDSNDIHVLAVAVAGSADAILTLNARDFPRGTLADEGLERCDPDGLLMDIWQSNPACVEEVAMAVKQQADALSGQSWEMRALLKKARLPRLGRALQGLD